MPEIIASGDCWSLDNDGLLEIFCVGPMYTTDWRDYAESITRVEIADGVTSIDNQAFYECYHLQSVVIPDSVTEIGEEAFAGDESAQCLTLGDKAETIGARAFADMPALELIELPGSVKTIADDAFAGSDPLIVCPKGSAAEAFAIGHGLRYFSR